MARIKGSKKSGGRKIGTPNKRTEELENIAQRIGVNPFEVLCLISAGNWKGLGYKEKTKNKWLPSGIEVEEDVISLESRLQAAKEACKYLFPQRKAVDLTAQGPAGTAGIKIVIEDYLRKPTEETK